MHRNGLDIFLYTLDQPLNTVLFFTTTQQKLFWSSRFTGAHYNNSRSTAKIQAVLSVQTQKADYCIISSEEATLFIPILGAKPKLTGFTTHALEQDKRKKKETEIVYTQSQADTEHLKMAPLRRHPCGFITAQRWLLLTASVSQIFGKSGQHNSSVKLNHTQVLEPPLPM